MSKLATSLAVAALSVAAVMVPAQAVPVVFITDLSGAAESPPNPSLGTGTARIIFDIDAHTMLVDVSFSGLSGTTTASHIHCCTATPGLGTAGVATVTPTFTGFPSGVTAGTYSHLFDTLLASTYNPAFIAAHAGSISNSEAALYAGMLAGESYLNVHSTFRPGGEIRGFLALPEPATLALIGLPMLALWRRARRPAAA
ncbi:MAG: CHRD domain-containing protein [Burkholderiales bacterium]|nr:CHRD domain-containing protein [Burkholderiales bacterium]